MLGHSDILRLGETQQRIDERHGQPVSLNGDTHFLNAGTFSKLLAVTLQLLSCKECYCDENKVVIYVEPSRLEAQKMNYTKSIYLCSVVVGYSGKYSVLGPCSEIQSQFTDSAAPQVSGTRVLPDGLRSLYQNFQHRLDCATNVDSVKVQSRQWLVLELALVIALWNMVSQN